VDQHRYRYRLQSDDPPSKVVDWYKERLRGAEVFSNKDGLTTLNAGDVKVVVIAETGGMITRGL
jgi:hypothetical protein